MQQPQQGQPPHHQQMQQPHPQAQQQQQQPGLLPHPHHQQQQQFSAPPPGFHQQQPHHPHQQQQFQHQPQQQQFMHAPQQPPPHMQQQHPQHQQQYHPQQHQQQQQSPPAPEHDPFLQHVVSASLVDLLGKQILVLLRDGRKLIGELLSFDQYSNIVVSGASERKVIGNSYYDEPLGLYVIRGENVVLLGDQQPSRLSKHSPAIEFKAISKSEFAVLEADEKRKLEAAGVKPGKTSAVRGEEDDLM